MWPALGLQYNPATETTSHEQLLELLRHEAGEANRATARLTDDAVTDALTVAATLVRERGAKLLVRWDVQGSPSR